MATKVKAQIPATPTPAAPAKNSLPPPRPFAETIPLLETATDTATLQTAPASPPPPNEQSKRTTIQPKSVVEKHHSSPLGYSFSQISVAPKTGLSPALLQPKSDDEDKNQPLSDGSFKTSQSIESRIQAKRGKGKPLPDTTRTFMENRFGNDFSQVRVHTDTQAVQLSQDLQAKAFTHGHNIYFNSGYYNPGSDTGKRLLAHELTHTIQQKGAKLKTKPSKPNTLASSTDTTASSIKRKSLANKIQRKESKSGIDVNLKPLATRIQRKSNHKSNSKKNSGIEVNLKPLAAKVQRKEENSGVDINLKPLAASVKSSEQKSGIEVNLKPLVAKIQPKEESSGVDINLKPLATKIQPKEENNGVDVNLKPLAAQIQRTKEDAFTIQPDLIVGAPNDPYEQEADRMADIVMDNSSTSSVQQKEEDASENEINLKPLAETIQTPEEHTGIDVNLKHEGKAKAPAPPPVTQFADINTDEQNVNITLKREDDTKEPPAPPVTQFPDLNFPDINTDEQNTNITLKANSDSSFNNDGNISQNPLSEKIQRANGRNPNRRRQKPIPYAAILGPHEENEDEQNTNITLKREDALTSPPVTQFPDLNTDEQNTNITLKASSDGSFQASSGIENKIKSSEGGGSSLPTGTQNFMESRFNNDFSGVKVHTDSSAVQMNKDLGAKAFTHKKDIYFNSGQYNPGSDTGKHLLAHELTHTIQQTGPTVKTKPDIQKEDDDEKKSISDVNEKTTEISDDDFSEDDIEKIEKDANKKEKDVEKGKKDKDKEGDKTEDEPEAEVLPPAPPGDVSDETDVAEDLKKEAQPPPEPGAPAMVPEVPPGSVGDDPQQNPAVLAVTQQIEQQGQQFAKHEDPKKETAEVADAVVDENQQDRKAKEKKTDATAGLDPETFDREAFVQQIFVALGIEEPQNMKDVEDGDGVGSEVEGTLDKEVGAQVTTAGGGIPEAAQKPPELDETDIKSVTPMGSLEGKINDMTPVTPEVDKAAPPAAAPEDVEAPLKEQTEGLEDTFGTIQTELIVGGPQDRYEVEADRMADTVMSMPAPQPEPIEAQGKPDIAPKVNQKVNKEERGQAKLSRVEDKPIIRAKSLAQMIDRSPQSILQRKNKVEAETIGQPVEAQKEGITMTTDRMETFGDMGGNQALEGLKESKKFSEKGPEQFRTEEEGAIANTKTRNQEKSQQTTSAMENERVQTMTNMATKKEESKGKNESARLAITEKLNAIYAESQIKVDGILAEMDAEVNRRMEFGKTLARRAFEIVQKEAFKKWQRNYYYHRHGIKIKIFWKTFKIFNIFLWAKEKLFTGLPDEVNKIYSDAREVYVSFLRKSIAGEGSLDPKVETGEVKSVLGSVSGLYDQLEGNAVAPYVEQKMGEAKAAIDEGKAKFQAEVSKLSPEEQQQAQETISNIQGQFDSLENNVKSYQDNLVNEITESYKEGLKEIDDRIEALKAANQGLVKQALAFIGDLIKAIIKALLAPIKWVLSKFGVDGSIIDAIIDDPGGFMSNFFTGLKDGFLNFAKNFPKHFLNGLVEWLFGNIGPLKLPKKFDLAGFFDIFMQIMGFTKDAIFHIAGEIMGHDIVGGIREAIEGANISEIIDGMDKKVGMVIELFYTLLTKGIGAAWNFLGDVISEMKMVFIKELSIMVSIEVVKAAITWLIGILNPAAGIIKIIKAVVDVIIWFAQNYERIIELIKTIFAGLVMIARGDTAGFSKTIELVLAGLIPIALGFLASLIGLGGIANKIRKIIQKVSGFFRKGLERLFKPIVAPIKKFINKGKNKYKKVKNKAKAKYDKTKAKVKDKYNKTKEKVKSKFPDKKKKKKKETEKDRQKAAYKKAVKDQKTEVKQIVAEGERDGEKLIENKRSPEAVKQGTKGLEKDVEKGKKYAGVKKIAVKTGMMNKKKYTLTGTIKKFKIDKKNPTKVRRQPVSGNAKIPQEALQLEALESQPKIKLRSFPLQTLQRKKPNWTDKKNKVVVDDKSGSSKFVLEARLVDESDVLSTLARDIEKKARKIKDKKPTTYFKALLPKLKKQYDLTSINLKDKTGVMDKFDRQIEYEITAKVPPQETKASRKAASGKMANAPVSGNIEHRIARSQGKGETLNDSVRQPMEQAFGVDFSGVRIHRKTEGDNLSRSLNAKAFTTGQDIYFRNNTYRPDTASGGHLLAHELTHVVQQSGNKPQVQRSPFFPQQLVQRQGDGAPPKPLLSHLGSSIVIQREGEGDVETGGDSGGVDLGRAAVVGGAVAAGAAVNMMDNSSQMRTDVDVYKDVSKKKGTMEVFVRVQKPDRFGSPQQQAAAMADDSEGIPDFTRTLIAQHIETILRQDPTRAVVETKLPEVALKFDLDLVKIVGYTEIGASFEYKVLAQGNPKSVARKKIEAMLKKMAKTVSGNQQPSAPQHDGTAELPTKPPAPEATTDNSSTQSSTATKTSKDRETGENPEGTPETRNETSSNTTPQRPLESEKSKTKKMTADSGAMADTPPPAMSTKTKIKPGGDPKTLFVIARVDPEDRG